MVVISYSLSSCHVNAPRRITEAKNPLARQYASLVLGLNGTICNPINLRHLEKSLLANEAAPDDRGCTGDDLQSSATHLACSAWRPLRRFFGGLRGRIDQVLLYDLMSKSPLSPQKLAPCLHHHRRCHFPSHSPYSPTSSVVLIRRPGHPPFLLVV